MSHIFFQYEVDGEQKWGIWSTVVDGIIMYDASTEQIVEYEAEKARQKRKDSVERQLEDIRNGDDKYRLMFMPKNVGDIARQYHEEE